MSTRQVLVKKITKNGFGRKVASEFGYASFEIAPTTLEIEVDPPIDLTTQEGKESYKKLAENLTKMSYRILEDDTKFYSDQNEELRLSLAKKDANIQKLKEGQ